MKYLEEVFQKNHWFIIEASSNDNFYANLISQKYIDRVIDIYKKTAESDLSSCEKIIVKGSENDIKFNLLKKNNLGKSILGYIPLIQEIGINSLPLIYGEDFKK